MAPDTEIKPDSQAARGGIIKVTKEEAGALADELKMKPGHKRTFINAVACE